MLAFGCAAPSNVAALDLAWFLSGDQSSVVVRPVVRYRQDSKTPCGRGTNAGYHRNECFAEVPTNPSHNKSVNADPSVRPFAREARIVLKARRSSAKFVYVLYCQYWPSICPRLAGKSWFFNI